MSDDDQSTKEHVAGAIGAGTGAALCAGDGGEWTVVTDADAAADVRLHGATFARVARGDRVDLARSVSTAVRRRRPDPSGRLTALRPALTMLQGPRPVTVNVDPPGTVGSPGRFPAATVATAGITATVAAVFFSPIFALLAGVSVIAVVGRWVGEIITHRRASARRNEARSLVRASWEQAARAWADAEEASRRANALNPEDLSALGDGEASPWWERLVDGDALTVSLGFGSMRVDVPVADGCELGEAVSEAQRHVDLRASPIEASLEPGFAVCGDRTEVLAAARWMIAAITARIGPADLGLVLATTADRVMEWDQLKWAPSLAGCVVVDRDRDDALSEALEFAGRGGASARRTVLVVVDGAEPTGSGVLARVLSGRVERVKLLWLGSMGDVPAGCRSSLTVAPDGLAVLEHLDRTAAADGTTTRLLHWHGCSVEAWDRIMRWLARFDDPECVVDGGGLPVAAALSDLVLGVAEIDDDRFAAVLERRWAAATMAKLVAAIGVDHEGPVEVDLVADGPHVLAAGTTGAGKSELLRTLVVGLANEQPPDVVSFVLVDFKGGGAFDAVSALPHVAAVVTDLDPAEAGRALRGLRAEILDREHRLRDMEISDVAEIDRSHPRSFGRMVVVVDEFATLADELPDFLDGLVDIARRGRSLGVHLVLATQRPSGVVTGQIRANTNLRLCLRVQDRADSIDVIDDPAAGQLPPIPGRAVLRRGGTRCQQFQVAHVSGEQPGPTAELFRLHRSIQPTGVERAVVRSVVESLAPIGHGRARARSLVDRIVTAVPDVARAAPPWMMAPGSVTFPISIDGSSFDGSALRAIGVLDDPDRRSIGPLIWRPDEDGLLVVGIDEYQIARTAATAIAATLDADPSLATYVLDGHRGGSASLAALLALDPVIDVVGIGEPERLVRAVEQLERTNEPRMVVVHNWTAIVDVLTDVAGPLGAERLTKLVRRAGSRQTAVVVTARSDRDVPQRVAGSLGCRVVHRLADPGCYVSFGLRPTEFASLSGSSFVEPVSGLIGVIAELDDPAIAALGQRIGRGSRRVWPEPVRVLGSRVDRATLPSAEPMADGWRVPVGLDVDLAPHWIVVSSRRPTIVVAHPGGGRTTAVTTVAASLGDGVCVIDDADALADAEVAALVADARTMGRPIVVGSTPANVKRFGTALAELLANATVLLLNPGRGDGDLVRIALPDLTDQPVGRAVSVDRGRATIVQIAA